MMPAGEVVPGDIVQARGRRHRAGRRPDRARGHAGDAGGGADRGERAGRQGRRRAGRATTSRSATASNMLFQNTSVTRGTATMVVTATGMEHRDGPDRHDADLGHAHPVAAAEGARRADQGARHHRLDGGRVHRRRRPGPRACRSSDVLLLGTAMAISAIPTGLPTFVSGDAVARRQAARRRQGRGQEPHRRRDARRDQRDQHRQDRHADDEPDDGLDALHRRRRGSPSRARATASPARSCRSPARRCPTSPGWPTASCSTATPPSRDDGAVVGDPTEAALVVLAAKLGVDAEETRRAYPRLAEVPFDSDYKFMATFHRVADRRRRARRSSWSRAAPDVVLARCSMRRAARSARQPGADRARRAPASRRPTRRMGEQGPAGARVRRPADRPTTS